MFQGLGIAIQFAELARRVNLSWRPCDQKKVLGTQYRSLYPNRGDDHSGRFPLCDRSE